MAKTTGSKPRTSRKKATAKPVDAQQQTPVVETAPVVEPVAVQEQVVEEVKTEAPAVQVGEEVAGTVQDEPLAGTGEAIQLNQDGTDPVVQEPAVQEDSAVIEQVAPVVEAPAVVVEEPAPVVEETAPVIEPTPEVEEPVVVDELAGLPVNKWTLDQVQRVLRNELKRPIDVAETSIVERGASFVHQVDSNYEAWSFRDVYRWLVDGRLPKRTDNGFYKNDPRRERKLAREWTNEEVVEFLRGNIKATVNAPADEIYQTAAILWSIPSTWSNVDIREYVLYNRQPAVSPKGLLINDAVRNKKPATYWTKDELVAFATGDIPPGEVANEDQLFKEIRLRFNLSDTYSNERLTQLLKEYKEEPLPMSLQFAKYNMEQYARNMGQGVAVDETGAAANQTSLYHTMTKLLRLEGRDFMDGWTMLLDFVNANRTTMFSEKQCFRGIRSMKLSDRERQNFEQLMNLVIRTANPNTRYAQVKDINFEVVLRGISDENIRQRVMSYYGLTA